MTDQELVIAAAEKVCGWKVYQSGRGSTIAEDASENERILATTHPWESVEWNPLESIADAWMLVEALWDSETVGAHLHKGKGFGAGLVLAAAQRSQIGAYFKDKIWGIGRNVFDVPEHGDSRLLGSHVCDSAPRAITLAALKAVGVEL